LKLAFVEQKAPDFATIERLLAAPAAQNKWSNRSPLYSGLRQCLSDHVARPAGTALVPLANGGMALEAMARLLSHRAGRKLRWVASSFSFRNIGRGYFHDVTLLDCDDRGLLDLDQCAALDGGDHDGIIVTNPFGLLDYGEGLAGSSHWLQNGKLSEIARAFHLDRLLRADDWAPRYLAQRRRLLEIACDHGFVPLAVPDSDIPMTAMPLRAPHALDDEAIGRTAYLTLAKYYQPLRDLPRVTALFSRLVNVPCHPDLARLTDDQIAEDLRLLSGRGTSRPVNALRRGTATLRTRAGGVAAASPLAACLEPRTAPDCTGPRPALRS